MLISGERSESGQVELTIKRVGVTGTTELDFRLDIMS